MSRTSAARFAARSRARRWWSWRLAAAVAAALALLGLAAWVLLASPLLAVREVGVVGADRVDPAAVVPLAGPVVGTPLARVDTGAVEERVARLPLVKEADVLRAWPGTLEVRIVERVPIASVPVGDRFGLVDADGVVVAEEAEPPADLPVVQLRAGARPGDPDAAAGLRAAADVLAELPGELRADVAQVTASTPDDVRMQLRDGADVVWGGPADGALKSQVLQALRSQDAEVYDVSAPLTPVTR